MPVTSIGALSSLTQLGYTGVPVSERRWLPLSARLGLIMRTALIEEILVGSFTFAWVEYNSYQQSSTRTVEQEDGLGLGMTDSYDCSGRAKLEQAV